MREDKLDTLLKEVYKNESHKIKDLDDISIPDLNEVFNKFENNLELDRKNNNEQDNKKDSIREINKKSWKLRKIGSIAAAFLIVVIIPMVMNKIQGFRSDNRFSLDEKYMLGQEKVMDEIRNDGEMGIAQIPSEEKGNLEGELPEYDFPINEAPSQEEIDRGDIVAKGNPLQEVATIEEAEEKVGFYVERPEYMIKGYEREALVIINISQNEKLVRQTYGKNNSRIYIEKSFRIIDNGEVNQSDKIKKVIEDNKEILLLNEEDLYKALWYSEKFKYEISSTDNIAEEEMIKIIRGFK